MSWLCVLAPTESVILRGGLKRRIIRGHNRGGTESDLWRRTWAQCVYVVGLVLKITLALQAD